MARGDHRSRRNSSSDSSESTSRSRSRSPPRRRRRRSPSVGNRLRNLSVNDRGHQPVGEGEVADGGEVDRPGQGDQQDNAENQKVLLKRMLAQHRDTISVLLAEQREELFDKVSSPSRKHTFKQKSIEKQFEINENFEKLAKRVEKALKSGRIEKAKDFIEKLVDEIEEHSEDLIGADVSRNGWLAVSRVRNRSSLPKNFLKELERVDASIDKSKTPFKQNGRPNERTRQVDGMPYSGNYVRTNRPYQKKSPEQLLEEASKQSRAGQCGHCQEEGHFYRECPSFWQKVKESRQTHIKK